MSADESAAPRVPRMDPVHARAWRALVTVGQQLPARLDAQLTDDAGIINIEYAILGALAAAPDSTLRMGALADGASSSTPRTSKAVTRLQKRGLVERTSCAGDGRAINVRLTREGLRTYLRATPPHIALARDTILGDLSDEELTTLAGLLERVADRLDGP
ncbi:MarR family transcriptional regulator [Brachybacterium paraconglomeratum]